MRVDKFLWCIRVFKTRTSATDHCREGKVFIADRPVKPAVEFLPTLDLEGPPEKPAA